MRKTSMVYGLVTGLAILVTFFALSSAMGPAEDLTLDKYKQAEAVGSIRYLILIIGIVAAMLAHRKKSTGAVSYRDAIESGVWAALICAVMVGAMEAAYMAMNPEFVEAAKSVFIEGMEREGKTAAEIAAYTKRMETWSFMETTWGMGLWYVFETAVAGTLVALIAGIFVKRKG